MLNLKDGTLWQWDIGRKMIITLEEGSTIDKVQFYNGIGDNAYPATSIEVVNGEILAGIPNSLLCYANNLTVYLMTTDEDGVKTQEQITLAVNKRAKPEDYIFTDDEFHTYKVYDERLQYLEENIVLPDRLKESTDTEVKALVPEWAREVMPDATLTKGGKAAEAAKVGAEIALLKQSISSPYNFKGSVATYAQLPTTSNVVNDTYYVTDAKCKYSWNGSAWYQSSLDEVGYQEELSNLSTAVNDNNIILANNYRCSGNYLGYTLETKKVLNYGRVVDTTSDHYVITSMIPVVPGDKVYIKAKMNYQNDIVAFFDADSTFIPSLLIGAAKGSGRTYYDDILTIPDGVAFIRVGSENERGYLEIKEPKFDIVCRKVEQECINYPSLSPSIAGNFIPDEVEKVELTYTEYPNHYIGDGGYICSYQSDYALAVSDPIEVVEGECLVITSSRWSSAQAFAFYDSYNTAILVVPNTTGSGTDKYKDYLVKVPKGATYLRVGSNVGATDVVSEVSRVLTFKLKTQEKPWSHLKWACVGDSLTERNSRTTISYHDYVAEKTGIEVVNIGQSGSGYAKKQESNNAFYQRITKVPSDTDVVTIFGSGNDGSSGLELGEPTDTGTETLCGCINTTIDNLIAMLPTVQLGIVTPTPWNYQPPNNENCWMSKYSNAIVEICKMRSIPCLDLYHCSNLRPWTEEGRNCCYTKDDGGGTHPDETGHKIIASRFYSFLQSLIGIY